MPKLAVNLTHGYKIQDSETVILYYIKMIWYATALLDFMMLLLLRFLILKCIANYTVYLG